jgi:hypothetical protein
MQFIIWVVLGMYFNHAVFYWWQWVLLFINIFIILITFLGYPVLNGLCYKKRMSRNYNLNGI